MNTNNQDLVILKELFEESLTLNTAKNLYDINFSIRLLHTLLEKIPNIPLSDLKLTLTVNIKQILAALEVIAFNMNKN